jgi:hypothetical protein
MGMVGPMKKERRAEAAPEAPAKGRTRTDPDRRPSWGVAKDRFWQTFKSLAAQVGGFFGKQCLSHVS